MWDWLADSGKRGFDVSALGLLRKAYLQSVGDKNLFTKLKLKIW